MTKSDLPFGSEFSPSQISLRRVLELADQHGGDWKAFEKAVQTEYFDKQNPEASDYNRKKLANNTKLGMRAYGLIDDDAKLTAPGRDLFDLRENEAKLYETLARHILLNLHGSTVVQTIQDMQAAGETPTLVKLRQWMEQRGVQFPRGGRHPSIMRLWLEKAGVFDDAWRVNEARLLEIRGIGTAELEVLAKLNVGQRFFLRALLNLGASNIAANDVERAATATYGYQYNEKGLFKEVVAPLHEAGYVDIDKTTRAKSPLITPTKKLIKEVYEPLLGQLEKQTFNDLRPLLRKSLAEIVEQLTSDDKHIKGLALEALAFRLMRLIDLDYVKTRLRGSATGGAEVDVIFQANRLVFSRWQVLCKSTSRISLDDVAKEVGLTHLMRGDVIMIVGTGTISPEARRYTNKMAEAHRILPILMLDGADLTEIARNPSSLVDILSRESPFVLTVVRRRAKPGPEIRPHGLGPPFQSEYRQTSRHPL